MVMWNADSADPKICCTISALFLQLSAVHSIVTMSSYALWTLIDDSQDTWWQITGQKSCYEPGMSDLFYLTAQLISSETDE